MAVVSTKERLCDGFRSLFLALLQQNLEEIKTCFFHLRTGDATRQKVISLPVASIRML